MSPHGQPESRIDALGVSDGRRSYPSQLQKPVTATIHSHTARACATRLPMRRSRDSATSIPEGCCSQRLVHSSKAFARMQTCLARCAGAIWTSALACHGQTQSRAGSVLSKGEVLAIAVGCSTPPLLHPPWASCGQGHQGCRGKLESRHKTLGSAFLLQVAELVCSPLSRLHDALSTCLFGQAGQRSLVRRAGRLLAGAGWLGPRLTLCERSRLRKIDTTQRQKLRINDTHVSRVARCPESAPAQRWRHSSRLISEATRGHHDKSPWRPNQISVDALPGASINAPRQPRLAAAAR